MALRTVFFGAGEFAVPSLRALAARTTCALVVTQPDRPSGRGHRLRPTPVKAAAIALGIPTIEPLRLREATGVVADVHAALFVLASYGKIVPPEMLELAQLGALNVHPSLLPLYRGATPLQSQVRDGVREGGVSLIFMDAGLDTGDVALRQALALDTAESYGDLHDRFARYGAELLGEALDRLACGTLPRIPQARFGTEEEARRTMTAPLRKEDLRVASFVHACVAASGEAPTARALVDFIRSLAAGRSALKTPVARSEEIAALVLGEQETVASAPPQAKIHAAHAASGPASVANRTLPGGAVIVDGSIFLRARDGWAAVDAFVLPGRKNMDMTQFRAKYGSLVAPSDLREELLAWSRHDGKTVR